MRAQCPKCKTFFRIDDSKIPEKGAHVICTKCQTRFGVKKSDSAQASPVKDKSEIHDIIPCPSCGHMNISFDKCANCGFIFSAEDKKNLVIKL